LASRGILADARAIWWQEPSWVAAALAKDPPRPASAWVPDRWTETLFGVVAAAGTLHRGQPASGGRATGRAVFVASPADAGMVRARDIIVLDRPRPGFAPLLWSAAAVVSRDGDPAAHLFEVARSLRVPAIAGTSIPLVGASDALAVDGTAGHAWRWALSERDEL
jgi:pyruvate,water dikinase